MIFCWIDEYFYLVFHDILIYFCTQAKLNYVLMSEKRAFEWHVLNRDLLIILHYPCLSAYGLREILIFLDMRWRMLFLNYFRRNKSIE